MFGEFVFYVIVGLTRPPLCPLPPPPSNPLLYPFYSADLSKCWSVRYALFCLCVYWHLKDSLMIRCDVDAESSGGHSPGKPGKAGEFHVGLGKVREIVVCRLMKSAAGNGIRIRTPP